jgi:hypothetical protein
MQGVAGNVSSLMAPRWRFRAIALTLHAGLHSRRSFIDGCAMSGIDGCAMSGLHSQPLIY